MLSTSLTHDISHTRRSSLFLSHSECTLQDRSDTSPPFSSCQLVTSGNVLTSLCTNRCFVLRTRSLCEDLWATSQYLKGTHREDREGLFVKSCSDRTKGNGYKPKEGKFRWDIQKKCVTVRVMGHWKRLLREAADDPRLAVFRLDGALSNLV